MCNTDYSSVLVRVPWLSTASPVSKRQTHMSRERGNGILRNILEHRVAETRSYHNKKTANKQGMPLIN